MYLQIATRWMNCLLMRELSLTAIIRLWVCRPSVGCLAATEFCYTAVALVALPSVAVPRQRSGACQLRAPGESADMLAR